MDFQLTEEQRIFRNPFAVSRNGTWQTARWTARMIPGIREMSRNCWRIRG